MKAVKFKNDYVSPNKVVCVGRNYVDHIKELNNEVPTSMVLFFKPNAAISNELVAGIGEPLHYEGEISLLVCNKEFVGVGFGLDLTKRLLQSKLKEKGLPWERAKTFRGSAVFSDFVSFENIEDLSLKLYINDVLVQKGGVELMMYKPEDVLEEVNAFIDFTDNDIVMTGTPKGVGTYKQDDVFVGQIYEGEKLLIEQKWIAQ